MYFFISIICMVYKRTILIVSFRKWNSE